MPLMSKDEIQALFSTDYKEEKIHWLFDTRRRVSITDETKCANCIHNFVCDHKMEARCVNYWFGTSAETGCFSCTNHYGRFDKDPVPCFYCPYFLATKESTNALS